MCSEQDKCGGKLDTEKQLQADTLFPECQRGPGGDRHNLQASLNLVVARRTDELSRRACSTPSPRPRLLSAHFCQERTRFQKYHTFLHPHAPAQLKPEALTALKKITTCTLPHTSAPPLSDYVPESLADLYPQSVKTSPPPRPKPHVAFP